MRYLLLTPYTYPYFDGSGLNALTLAHQLKLDGNSASVLTYHLNKEHAKNQIVNDVALYRISWGFSAIFSYISFLLKTDVLIIFGENIYAFEFVIKLAKLMGKKVVYRSTKLDVDDISSLVEKKSKTKNALSKIDFYYSLHKEFTKRYTDVFTGSGKILQLSPGVNTDTYKPNDNFQNDVRQKLNINDSQKVLLFVGATTQETGFDNLIKQLAKADFDFLLLVIGEQHITKNHPLFDFQAEIEELTALGKNTLKEKIQFVEATHHIMPYYQAADIVLVNSKTSNFPNVLLEAMACGKPVVCNKFIGLDKDTIRNNHNAFVCSTPHEISEYISRIINSEKIGINLGKNARKTVEQNHDIKKVAKELSTKLNAS